MRVDANRVRELFFGALDLEPEAIPAYLDEACGDDAALRAEVASLLGFHDESDLVAQGSSNTAFLETLVDAHEAPLPSTVDTGRYRELSELGVGGCGRVTRAWDAVLKRVIAHKRVRFDDEMRKGMLQHEARLLAWLDHPGAVPVFEGSFDEEAGAFYTMRLLEGDTLRERLDAKGQLAVREAIRIVARISETMANAHAKGVLHLDLKPANIMLLPYGQVCILDWGVARFHDMDAYRAYLRSVGEAEEAPEAGYAGVAGTPAYMPVEQATGDGVSVGADIYACGTLLYEMLAGELPHRTGSSALAVFQKALAEVTPLREHRADIPEALEALCLQMIAPDPDDRPASFDDVLAALDQLNHGATNAEERRLAPGQVLFREGDRGAEAFQILEGAVAISVAGPEGPTELARRGVGDLIGEMAVVSGAPRSATVTAVEPTRVAVVTGDVIERALEASNPLVARMLRSLVDRLREEADRARQS